MNKQARPYIFCHMETSLDGKIMGKYLWIEETNAEDDSFYALFAGENAVYKPQALLNGRMVFCYPNAGSQEVLRDIPEAIVSSHEEMHQNILELILLLKL